jgi:hypothetical protein
MVGLKNRCAFAPLREIPTFVSGANAKKGKIIFPQRRQDAKN